MRVLEKGLNLFFIIDSVLSVVLLVYLLSQVFSPRSRFCTLMWGFSVPFGIMSMVVLIPAIIFFVVSLVKYLTIKAEDRDIGFLKFLLVNIGILVAMYLLASYWIIYHQV